MQQFFAFTVSGLATASIYAVAAAGLVLTYTTTGVFNFAHGALAMLGAFGYWELRFGWHWSAPAALAVCLGVAAPLAGVVLERAMMRRLVGAAESVKLVSTVGLMLGLVGLATWIWDPARARPERRFFEGRVLSVAGVRIAWHTVGCIALGVVVAAGLRLLLTRTRLGLAMRANVDDAELLRLHGARESIIATAAWMLGTVLAALAGILIAPTLNLSALPLTLLVVNAYAAAVIGRLASLPGTAVGALVLGLVTEYSRGYSDHLPVAEPFRAGLLASVPIIVLFVALLVVRRPAAAPTRAASTPVALRPAGSRGPWWFAVAVVVGGALLAAIVPADQLVSLGRMWGLGIVALSLIPVMGYAGQLTLCQLSFAGIGMVMVQHLGRQGNPLALVAAVVVPAAIGAVVALPSFRLSGIYLALSTAAFAVVMDRWIFPLPEIHLGHHTLSLFNGGSLELAPTRYFGVALSGRRAFYVYGAVAFALVAWAVGMLRRSAYGQRLVAVADSPHACATLGLNPNVTKLGVFALSAGMAGLGGALYGQALRAVTPDSVQFLSGLAVVTVMVVVGITAPSAALVVGLVLGFGLNAVVLGHLAGVLPRGMGTLAHVAAKLGTDTLVLVGSAGLVLGRHPDGLLSGQLQPRWRRWWQRRRERVIALTVAGGVVVARVAHLLSNWWFVTVGLCWCLLTLVLGGRADAIGGLSQAPEWLGIAGPVGPEDLEVLDQVLALPPVGGVRGAPGSH